MVLKKCARLVLSDCILLLHDLKSYLNSFLNNLILYFESGIELYFDDDNES